jgi:diaminopimelate epimerase
MNGLGNEIIVADMRGRADRVEPAAAVALNNHPETRFDQVMAIHDPRTAGTDYFIDILNSDGSSAQACGNGMRCVVSALVGAGTRRQFTFETVAGLLPAEVLGPDLIAVDMGRPRFGWQEIPLAQHCPDTRRVAIDLSAIAPALGVPSAMSMGNPHLIFWVERDVGSYDLERFGPLLEHHPLFPERANISIVKVTGRQAVTMRTWERGAGLTKACGSAACAAAVGAARIGKTGRSVAVTVPGGTLAVDWRADDHVVLTGPAAWEFSGRFDPGSGAWTRDRQDVA